MKTVIVVFALLSSLSSFSQESTTLAVPKILFKVSPQHFANSTLKIGTEFFNKSGTKSYTGFLSYRYDNETEAFPYFYGSNHYNGIGGEFQYRKYLSPMKNYQTKDVKIFLQGIYIAGYATGGSYSNQGDFLGSKFDEISGEATNYMIHLRESVINYGAGFTIGVHRTLWDVLFVDAYVGGGIQLSTVNRKFDPSPSEIPFYSNSNYSSIKSPGYQGIMPKFGIQLGVAL